MSIRAPYDAEDCEGLVGPEVVALHYKCTWAGATEYVVWEDVERFEAGLPPDYFCCGRCHQMHDWETGELLT